jgi:hypothetical protein
MQWWHVENYGDTFSKKGYDFDVCTIYKFDLEQKKTKRLIVEAKKSPNYESLIETLQNMLYRENPVKVFFSNGYKDRVLKDRLTANPTCIQRTILSQRQYTQHESGVYIYHGESEQYIYKRLTGWDDEREIKIQELCDLYSVSDVFQSNYSMSEFYKRQKGIKT